MRSDRKRLLLRATGNAQNFLKDTNPDAVTNELKLLGKAEEFSAIDFVGSGTSKEQIIALNEHLNEQNRKVGCPNFGGSIELQEEPSTLATP
jgi:hypothetical protein